MKLVCLCNTPYIAGDEVTILTEAPKFTEDNVGEIFIDDPWWGVVPLTVVDYDSDVYPTFNVWGSIMFDATCAHFKSGTAVWWGKLMAYVTPKGSKVLA